MPKIIGFPYKPEIIKPANCGPIVLAALLGIGTKQAMALMDKTYQTGWHGYTNIGHFKAALEYKGIEMQKTNVYDKLQLIPYLIKPTLIFIQIEGPWMGKGWRAEYTRTHWILIHQDNIMDVNNPKRYNGKHPQRPNWETRQYWEKYIIPAVITLYKQGTGWHIRASYYIKE